MVWKTSCLKIQLFQTLYGDLYTLEKSPIVKMIEFFDTQFDLDYKQDRVTDFHNTFTHEMDSFQSDVLMSLVYLKILRIQPSIQMILEPTR